MKALICLATLVSVTGCDAQQAAASNGGTSARVENAQDLLENTDLKVKICEATSARSGADFSVEECDAGDFEVAKTFSPSDEPDFISMIHLTTTATFSPSVSTCGVIARRDWSRWEVLDDGEIERDLSWTIALEDCGGLGEYTLSIAELLRFNDVLQREAEAIEMTEDEAAAYCDGVEFSMMGMSKDMVDLDTRRGSGELSVVCDDWGMSQVEVIRQCQTTFDLDEAHQIVPGSEEVVGCE